METEDEVIYTADVVLNNGTRTVDPIGDNKYCFFSFATKLMEAADDWAGLAPYRFGAVSEATVDNPNHTTYSNPEGVVGQLVRTGGQMRFTGDGGKSQMYANKVKGQTNVLKLREKKGYEYQFTLIFNDSQEESHVVENYLMDMNHWEYNDKKGHVKFFVENYATDHYYMDKEEWQAKKKAMKVDYSNKITLGQLDAFATSHNLPVLSPAARQAIGKLKQW